MKRILIRADGNEYLATGHLMRCLSVCGALQERGVSVDFAVSDGDSEKMLKRLMQLHLPPEHDRPGILVLRTDYRDYDNELPVLLPLLSSYDVLLADSYAVTENWMTQVRSRLPLAYIDDLYLFPYPADLVINYDILPDGEAYRSCGKTLLGSTYTPLRPQFCALPFRLPLGNVKKILISSGGSDPYGGAPELVKSFLSDDLTKDLEFAVLTGPMHIRYEELQQLSASYKNVNLLENVQDMAELFSTCDLAISAAGTTLYELCAASLPSVSYIFADNQLETAAALEKVCGMPFGGDLRSGVEVIRQIKDKALLLAGDLCLRQTLASRMKNTVDGEGSGRIADALVELIR